MNQEKAKSLRRSLTAHFAIIAWLTAMLVATGSGSIFLPVFIFVVSVTAFVLVDVLEWIELGWLGSSLGMIAATGIAVASYIYSAFVTESEAGQLMAVAGLLVYPEAVLFMQRKNLRIFEQLAVFLLLEMVVAALVNDNISFGLLMAPIMLLWVSSLFLFSRYATLVQIDPTIETQLPKLAEVLFKRFMKTVMGSGRRRKVVTAQFVMSSSVQDSHPLRRLAQSFPIGVGALVFASLFFYLLPRTTPGGFQSALRGGRSVGLPERLTFGNVGRVLRNRTLVMRVSIKQAASGKPYDLQPESEPYLRSLVFDRYGSDPSGRRRTSPGEWRFSGYIRSRGLRGDESVSNMWNYGRDIVHVEFDIRRRFVSQMFAVPPLFAVSEYRPVEMRYDPYHMLIKKLANDAKLPDKSLVYQLGTAAFADGLQSPVTPVRWPNRGGAPSSSDFRRLRELMDGFGDEKFRSANEYRINLLRSAGIDDGERLRAALLYEDHLANSGEFVYSLDLKPPTDPDLDPIVDFLINQRSGHCQYFASSMVALLRQTGVPSRIVIGYRPTEYNKYGDYYAVRQSDAHAWVEALFPRSELEGTKFDRWLTDAEFYWVRFDPTAPVAGGLRSGQQAGQAIDFAEKLWKDYVVEANALTGDDSLYYAAENENAYETFIERFNRFRDDFRSGRLFTGEVGFAWPMAITIFAAGFGGVLLWQAIVMLPRFAPRLAIRLGVMRSDFDIRHEFFARCLRLLTRVGVHRQRSDTPHEVTQKAGEVLADDGQQVHGSLSFLTWLYYRLRFSTEPDPTGSERSAIDSELRKLEEAVSAARR